MQLSASRRVTHSWVALGHCSGANWLREQEQRYTDFMLGYRALSFAREKDRRKCSPPGNVHSKLGSERMRDSSAYSRYSKSEIY